MSQQKGDGGKVGFYEHEHEYHEDELDDESANNAATVKPMKLRHKRTSLVSF